MVRPVKCRRVEVIPEKTYFIPCSKARCHNHKADEVILKIEELEAIRLKDMEELSQEACAKRMQISRQTFQNIVDEARKKVAMALVSGYAIQIQGGDYTHKACQFRCLSCGEVYGGSHEDLENVCKKCGAQTLVCQKGRTYKNGCCRA